MTDQQSYRTGYQQALDDLAEALERGGDSEVFAWIFDNAERKTTRSIVSHLTGRPGDREAPPMIEAHEPPEQAEQAADSYERTTAEGLIFDVEVPGQPDLRPVIHYDTEVNKWIGYNEHDGGVWSRAGSLNGAIRTAKSRFGAGINYTPRPREGTEK